MFGNRDQFSSSPVHLSVTWISVALPTDIAYGSLPLAVSMADKVEDAIDDR